MNWSYIESLNDLNNAISQSVEERILIFKHSTRCPVSFMAKRKIESEWSEQDHMLIPYFLDLIKFRSISNEIVLKTGVQHESPQAIVLFKNEVIYHASHYDIELHNI